MTAQRTEVVRIAEKLHACLLDSQSDVRKIEQCLAELKPRILSSQEASVLGSEEHLDTLCRLSYLHEDSSINLVASKCLANVLLLDASSRQVFVNRGDAVHAATRLKNDDFNDELVNSRILFLLTYGTTQDFSPLLDRHDLAKSINKNLAQHVKRYENRGDRDARPTLETLALVDTLKLLFNILQYYPAYNAIFEPAVTHVSKILYWIKPPSPPLQDPIPALINALLNLNLEPALANTSDAADETQPRQLVEALLHLLEAAVIQYQDAELENLCIPLLTLTRKVYEIAPRETARRIQGFLLPSDTERERPLGRSDSLASRFLRLSISPSAPNFGPGISAFMFEMSDKDPAKFVQNIGYGYAAGFLMSQKFPIPDHAQQREGAEGDVPDINPITGQRRDMEPHDTSPEMTDEEKEREAERLFVLFERLKATGVANVMNPVEAAMREGRLEELD